MKAILEFDLEDIDDRLSHLRCIKSLDMVCALFELQSLWRKWKHADKEPTSEEIFDAISEIFDKHNISLDELVQ